MNGTQLKILALILMLVDHIAEFIPFTPIWFHYIGRLSAPVFMFCMIWGVYYTHNRKLYLTRMYMFGVIMALMNIICNNLYKNPYTYISNNIFVTLLLIGILCSIFDIRKQNRKKGNIYLIMFIIFQIISTLICALLSMFINLKDVIMFFSALIPNILLCEGSFIFVIFGVILYYTKENKIKFSLIYTLFSSIFLLSAILSGKGLFNDQCQWMMIGALPLLLFYNNKKGIGLKYLFYIFYPVHIFLLFWIGNIFF